MAKERTLSFIKPDGVGNNLIGEIIHRFESAGLQIVAAKMVRLSLEEAQEFYSVHKERPFFSDLVQYIISGPIMAMVLEGENAITKNRELMGATNPQQATPGTIRGDFGKGLSANVVHGSDGPETARQEISFFFNGSVCSRSS